MSKIFSAFPAVKYALLFYRALVRDLEIFKADFDSYHTISGDAK